MAAMRFTASVLRHGIVERSIRHVVDEYGYAAEVELVSNPDALGLLFVGDDLAGYRWRLSALPCRQKQANRTS